MRRKARKLLYAGVAFLLLFAVLYTKDEVTLAGNESSRFGVVQAIGEQGVFHIEQTNFASTVDKMCRNILKQLFMGRADHPTVHSFHSISSFPSIYNILIPVFLYPAVRSVPVGVPRK